MREHRSEKRAPTPWRFTVAVEEVSEAGQRFALAADADIRTAVARVAGLRDLPRLEANFDVTRQDAGGLRVIGRVSATVGQNCVVTLEPLANEVEEDIHLVFIPRAVAERLADETETVETPREVKAGDPEPLIDGVIDLGALATEFLILGLDSYPRKPGAIFEPPLQAVPDESPFAALAGWTKGSDEP